MQIKIITPFYDPLGDWLKFSNMGAYTICIGTEFNGMRKPVIYYYITEPVPSILFQ